jgi:hypothetical protein
MEQEQQATIAGQQGKAVTEAFVQESCAMSGQGGTAASAVARIAAPACHQVGTSAPLWDSRVPQQQPDRD